MKSKEKLERMQGEMAERRWTTRRERTLSNLNLKGRS